MVVESNTTLYIKYWLWKKYSYRKYYTFSKTALRFRHVLSNVVTLPGLDKIVWLIHGKHFITFNNSKNHCTTSLSVHWWCNYPHLAAGFLFYRSGLLVPLFETTRCEELVCGTWDVVESVRRTDMVHKHSFNCRSFRAKKMHWGFTFVSDYESKGTSSNL